MKHVSVNKNIIFNILKSFMGIVFPIISFPYAARVLGVEKIGLVNYCNTIIGYFILLSGLGINIYATREGVKYRDSKELLSRFTKEILLINILSTLTSYAILFVLVVCTDLRKNAVLLCICSMSIVFTTFQIEWLFQIMEQFTYISIRSIVFQAVSFIILVMFVKNPNDYLIYAIINVFASCGNFWLNIIKSCQYVDWKLRCRLTPQKHIKPI
ncbi:MAG: oligosaccharide flippase family protein, partial [Agathobacter sp.]|nr:oligosaccharide flippase family protein [Agathobacter sp.]